LSAASVLGREFSLDALELVIGLPAHVLLEALDEAIAARAISEVPAVPAAARRLRFSHALIRDVLYDELSLSRRVKLHREIGDAQTRAGDEPTAKETFLRAASLARELRASEQLARAALGYGGRFVWARAGSDERLVPFLEDALAALGEVDSPLRVRLLARLAGA